METSPTEQKEYKKMSENDFVNLPLLKKLNRKNIVSRLEKVESKAGIGPSARVNALSDLTQNLGEQVAGIFKCVDPNTGTLRGYMAAIPQPNAPGYHLAFFNNAGVFQFGIDADDGSAIAGAGAVILDADGITILSGSFDANTIKWKDTNGNTLLQIYESGSPDYYAYIRADNITGHYTYLTFKPATETIAISGNLTVSGTMDVDGACTFTGSPVNYDMLVGNPSSIGQGTWARAVNASFLHNGYYGNNASHANGDNFTISVYLPAGTYTLRFNASKSNVSGIVKVEVGPTNLGNTDLYAAAPDYTNIVEYTGISIASGGVRAVKFTVNGKNVASGNYYFDIGLISFIRTA